ncbi:MAG: N-acetyltransferase [Gammaproteobacteria bacterium]|nr:N-acetyltransferase [Gammaproteobacteria bacterium]MCP5202464.1 N-acetyltransferase [Gammaproteobacteria bacterium]
MRLSVTDSLATVEPAAWDALAGSDPFLRHGFLHGLEDTDCLAPQGWYPQHLLVHDDDQRLVGAMPLYLRDNSYGEFVFDWSWADAYERAGGRYYPKLVTAVPFSPVSGHRLLLAPGAGVEVAALLAGAGVRACEDNALSSWHCLFLREDEKPVFEQAGLLARLGCQYHWFNDGYVDFDAFLAALSSKKRKQIKRERRQVATQNLVVETLVGDAIGAEHWAVFHQFYCSTFHRKWGEPRLTEAFFQSLNERLPGAPVLILARADGHYVAGAFALQGGDTLYGRHWGCTAYHDTLHFELCYYQTIDFCIRNGLARLDAGAQGEHKLARGFVPVKTWSMHWIGDRGFRRAVADFLAREHTALEHYIAGLDAHLAFRQAST